MRREKEILAWRRERKGKLFLIDDRKMGEVN